MESIKDKNFESHLIFHVAVLVVHLKRLINGNVRIVDTV